MLSRHQIFVNWTAWHEKSDSLVASLLGLLVAATLLACGAKPTPVAAAPVTTIAEIPTAAPLELAAPQVPASDALAANVPVGSGDPQWGAQDAPVTVVYFSDFQCPFCARVEPTLKLLRDSYGPRKLRLVWKNNPLPFHSNARPAAEAAMAVFGLGGNAAFWGFHDRAFGNQAVMGDEHYAEWASDVGVDSAQLALALASREYSAKIDADLALAATVGAQGTPTFRINGVTLNGAQPLEKFQEVIDQQLADARAAVASGVRPVDVYATLTNKNQVSEREKVATPRREVKPEGENDVWRIPILPDDPRRGSKDALVTLVEFSDFQCPFCKRVEETLKKIATTYGDDVRLVWKDNPLPFHPRAKPAATLARFSYKQRGEASFWQVHDQLFASNPKLEDSDLAAIAQSAGLSWPVVKRAIDSDKFGAKIDASAELAFDVQARGTPHFFINGVRLSGSQPFETFKKLIDEQLEKAKTIVASGVPRARVYDEIMKDGKVPPPPERRVVAAPDATDPAKGGAHARVVIQEFADFQCPFCRRAEPTLRALEKTYGNKIKIVWRHLPLQFHKNAPLAAQAAQEVFTQKGSAAFWAFHDRLFEGSDAQEQRTERDSLAQFARSLGVDMTKFDAALDGNVHAAKVEADARLANSVKIDSTPAFLINDYYLSGAQPESAFKKLIDRALKETAGSVAAPIK